MREERKDNSQECVSSHTLSLVRLPESTTAPGHRSSSLQIRAGFESTVNNRVVSEPGLYTLFTHIVCEADEHMRFAVELSKHGEIASLVLYITWYINNWETGGAVVCMDSWYWFEAPSVLPPSRPSCCIPVPCKDPLKKHWCAICDIHELAGGNSDKE